MAKTANTSDATAVAPLVMVTAGQDLPLLHFRSAKGNDCFGVLARKADGSRYLSKYGVGIPALADRLPESVTIKSGDKETTLHLDHGFTESSGHPKVFFSGAQEIPGQGRKMVRVSISETKTGWNVIAKVLPMGETGGRVTSLADLW